MKNCLKLSAALMCLITLLLLTSCTKFDSDYGKSIVKTTPETEDTSVTELVYPEIKSGDEVMPKYFDISRFDEENYSDYYLGKKFKFNVTYAGTVLDVPSSYAEMAKDGWDFVENSEYSEDSSLMAGKILETDLCDKYGIHITAVFYNSSKSSKKLNKCEIVKFIVPENCLNVKDSVYGQFWVNGVTNQSAINNIVEYLGTPSHFYAVDSNHYYLDYFLNSDNKRSGVTIHVDPENDILLSVEISDYE